MTDLDAIVGARAGRTDAMDALAQRYLGPLHGFARAQGWSHEDAEDEVNAFLARFLGAEPLGGWEAGRGSFRNYLLGSFGNHLRDAHRRRLAQRRGAGAHHTQIRWHTESTGGYVPVAGETPAQVFDRLWAVSVARRAWRQLVAEQRAAGRGDRFEQLKAALLGETGSGPQPEDVRTAVSRLRSRLRTLFREQLAWPGATDAELKSEMVHLHELLGGHEKDWAT